MRDFRRAAAAEHPKAFGDAFARVAEIVRIFLGASRANLTLVVEEARVRDAVMRLHYAFFGATAPAAA